MGFAASFLPLLVTLSILATSNAQRVDYKDLLGGVDDVLDQALKLGKEATERRAAKLKENFKALPNLTRWGEDPFLAYKDEFKEGAPVIREIIEDLMNNTDFRKLKRREVYAVSRFIPDFVNGLQNFKLTVLSDANKLTESANCFYLFFKVYVHRAPELPINFFHGVLSSLSLVNPWNPIHNGKNATDVAKACVPIEGDLKEIFKTFVGKHI